MTNQNTRSKIATTHPPRGATGHRLPSGGLPRAQGELQDHAPTAARSRAPRSTHPLSHMTSQRCTATRRDGSPCRAWAVHGTHPPRCSAHRGHPDWGAPEGNHNATKHGYYADADLPADCSIDAVIDMLYQKQIALDAYIDDILRGADATIEDLAHLFRVHGQNASRIGRLLRDRRALSGDTADGISGAIARALDELNSEFGDDFT